MELAMNEEKKTLGTVVDYGDFPEEHRKALIERGREAIQNIPLGPLPSRTITFHRWFPLSETSDE